MLSMHLGEPVQKLTAPNELIERKIYFIRGQKVMLDSDLAALYQVPTKSLNLGVKRNAARSRKTSCFSSRRKRWIL